MTFLEDSWPSAGMMVMVSDSATKTLPRYCRGGEHCCTRDIPVLCGEGEGDCNTNGDCAGLLECGRQNCESEFGSAGGLWDAGDDCCHQKCTDNRPCAMGQVGLVQTLLRLKHICLIGTLPVRFSVSRS